MIKHILAIAIATFAAACAIAPVESEPVSTDEPVAESDSELTAAEVYQCACTKCTQVCGTNLCAGKPASYPFCARCIASKCGQ